MDVEVKKTAGLERAAKGKLPASQPSGDPGSPLVVP